MQQEQLALFGDDQIVGTGQPHPWPAAVEADEDTVADPNQLAFADEPGMEAA